MDYYVCLLIVIHIFITLSTAPGCLVLSRELQGVGEMWVDVARALSHPLCMAFANRRLERKEKMGLDLALDPPPRKSGLESLVDSMLAGSNHGR